MSTACVCCVYHNSATSTCKRGVGSLLYTYINYMSVYGAHNMLADLLVHCWLVWLYMHFTSCSCPADYDIAVKSIAQFVDIESSSTFEHIYSYIYTAHYIVVYIYIYIYYTYMNMWGTFTFGAVLACCAVVVAAATSTMYGGMRSNGFGFTSGGGGGGNVRCAIDTLGNILCSVFVLFEFVLCIYSYIAICSV